MADGTGGLKIVQLTSPDLQPKFYGFSPMPNPYLIASHKTKDRVLSLSRPLERDRAVDEAGNQIAVFGRRGSRPFNEDEIRKLYLDLNNEPWFVENEPGTSQTPGTAPVVGQLRTNSRFKVIKEYSNVRVGPGTEHEILTTLNAKGELTDTVTVVSLSDNGWYKIELPDGDFGYIGRSLLEAVK